MDIGLLTLGDWVADPATGHRPSEVERHRNIVEQAVVGEAAGFSSIHLGERAAWERHYMDYLAAAARWVEQSAQRAGAPLRPLPVRDYEAMLATIAICGSPDEVVDRMGSHPSSSGSVKWRTKMGGVWRIRAMLTS